MEQEGGLRGWSENEQESPFHVGTSGSLLSNRGISKGRALPTQCRANANALRQECSWLCWRNGGKPWWSDRGKGVDQG